MTAIDRQADDYRHLSLWLDTFPGSLEPRPALEADLDIDVAIVGGGFTGLWTAYYLAERDPTLRIAVLERDICGFGASGRNGGWCIAELAAGIDTYAALSSHDKAMRQARTLFAAVDEVERVSKDEGFDCRFAKGGAVYLARNAAQGKRQLALIEAERAHGFTEDEVRYLSADEAKKLVNATGVRSGIHFAATAALDPARLVRGLADAVVSRGVTIYEQTAVSAIERGRVVVDGPEGGSELAVKAPSIIRATEGYSVSLAGERRTLAPIYSLMIATEPLDQAVFDEIGLADRPTFADDRYAVIYGQRTADGRLAFGGRGVPYLYGSRIDPATERHGPTHRMIHETLVDLFPVLSDVEITHRWGGVMGAPRNWTPAVSFDRSTGLGSGGGYIGEGVCPSNLAGRTLADLVTGTDSDLVTLPWVNVTSRKWEPEPLRWLGVWGTRRIMGHADRKEYSSEKESRLGRWAYELLR